MHHLLGGLVSSFHVLIKFFAKEKYTMNETQGGIPWTILTTQKIYVRAASINMK